MKREKGNVKKTPRSSDGDAAVDGDVVVVVAVVVVKGEAVVRGGEGAAEGPERRVELGRRRRPAVGRRSSRQPSKVELTPPRDMLTIQTRSS